MSLILDALKRAERERRLERSPDLDDIFQESPTPRRRLRPWLWLTGAFLAGAVIVALVLWPKAPVRIPSPPDSSDPRPPITERSTKAPEAVQPSSPAPKKAKETPTHAQPGPSLAAKERPGRPRKPDSPMPDSQIKDKGITEPSPAQLSKAPDTSSTREPAKPRLDIPASLDFPADQTEFTPVTPPPVERETHPSDPSRIVASQRTDTPFEQTAVSESELDSRRLESIPLVRDLPYDIRERLEKLEINVHAYSDYPEERLVFINMRNCKIGDQIGESGVVLREITPEGVIVDYGEGQARVKVNK